MSGYNSGNYTEQGGDSWVIGVGGTLDIAGTLKRSGVDVSAELDAALATPTTGSVAVAADALAIPLTAQYVAKTTGADAEALTLADGTPGQTLVISLEVDGGGTGTLTPTTASGFVSIAFADAGDTVALKYVDDTVGWVVLGTAGVTAPPAIALS
jgi:hypothetical protein